MPQHFNCRPSEIGKLLHAHELERQRRLVNVCFEAAAAGVPVVQARLPKDQGPLRESTAAVRRSDGADLRIDAPYAGYVEMGTRPHWVPLKVILGWVWRHVPELGISTAAQLQAAARAIQQKIAREGTRPTWAMRGALGKLRDLYDDIVRRRLVEPYSR